MTKTMRVGLIGCGNISDIYLINSKFFNNFDITACADINMEAAQKKAKEYNITAMSVDALMAADDIDIILNLTVPAAHFEVSKQALIAGKHVYSEKPIALSSSDVETMEKLATSKGLYLCSAPDTFLGPTHQYVKELFSQKPKDNILSGTVHMMGRGMEHWHPNPDFFFKKGGGPILDIGPYYISLLVYLLGPITSVYSKAKIGLKERTVTAKENYGKKITVETPTTVSAMLEFASGTSINLMMSWDVWKHGHNLIELYGVDGSYILADPNHFGGSIRFADNRDTFVELNPPEFHLDNGKEQLNLRGIGIADMIRAIDENRPARCGLNFAGHCFAVLEAIMQSSEQRKEITLPTVNIDIKPLPFDEMLSMFHKL